MTTESVTTLPADLGAAVDRARSTLDDAAIAELLLGMVAIASPTGEEAPLARFVADHLSRAGVEAEVQSLGEGDQANLVGRLAGAGDGPTLLVYAALDTAFSGDLEEDRPFLGDTPRADFALPPSRDGSFITGLGAENPKGFAAAGIAALEAIARADAPLRGEVVLMLASGSMPDDARPGHGTGIRHFLEGSTPPDFAIVLKPGYAVGYEEVGLAWFRIIVHGAVNYTGIRHKGPYRNPILGAARVVLALEAWFAEYSARHTDGLVAPQGSINAIRAGAAGRAAFVPATCEIDVDLRVGPRSTPDTVEAELREAIEAIRADDPTLEVTLERRVAFPGTSTDPSSWIVRSLTQAWEEREGREHAPLARGSGATDAAILRSAGIPTARIGLPPPSAPNPASGFSMGYVDAASVHRLADVLVQAVIDTTGRPRDTVLIGGTP
ncbi:MAG TPA: M20/M25/M40 family metallo-hydrolase [Candidatus Saccharimonadales bacterium]|nr:M20/M25/M40 family metallo-hydrolase [Candidatus Saccharimonadales bacterium]